MLLADITNQYIDKQKPWKKIKDDELKSEVQGICTQALCMFKVLMTYLKPILPKMAKDVEDFLNIESLNFANVHEPLLNHQINKFKPLLSRIDDKSIEAIIEASKTSS
jgi:methionyl-tRNA synthetase